MQLLPRTRSDLQWIERAPGMWEQEKESCLASFGMERTKWSRANPVVPPTDLQEIVGGRGQCQIHMTVSSFNACTVPLIHLRSQRKRFQPGSQTQKGAQVLCPSLPRTGCHSTSSSSMRWTSCPSPLMTSHLEGWRKQFLLAWNAFKAHFYCNDQAPVLIGKKNG